MSISPQEPWEPGDPTGAAQDEQAGESSTWRPVEDASAPETPAEEAPPATPTKPPLPLGVKIGGTVAAAALIGLAAYIGMSLGGGPGAEPEPAWPLTAPQQVGDYVVGTVTESPVPTDEGRSILRATYADGANRIVLLMSRPETDLTEYLTNAGVEDTTPAGTHDVCGISVDTGLTVCGRMQDETGILMVGLSDQDATTLAPLLNDFVEVLLNPDTP